jgi:predicted Zn-dependent peptidase
VSLDETERHIDAVSAEEVQEVAQDLYGRQRLSLVAIGPVEKKLFGMEDLWG